MTTINTKLDTIHTGSITASTITFGGISYATIGAYSGLNKAFYDVKAFHVAFSHPAPATPTIQPLGRADKRADWIDSESQELRDARTLVDQADAYIDIIYFALGGLVELGIKPQPLFDIVHKANMAKLHADGKPRYHDCGKVKKPEGWEKPEPKLLEEVNKQIAEALNNG